MAKAADRQEQGNDQPISGKTPLEVVIKVLREARATYERIYGKDCSPQQAMLNITQKLVAAELARKRVAGELDGSEVRGALSIPLSGTTNGPSDGFAEHAAMVMIDRSAKYALAAHRSGDMALAWRHAVDVAMWHGVFQGSVAQRIGGSRAVAEMARRAARARHAPSNERKVKIQAWYMDNQRMFKSMDAAAERAADVFKVAFRTARKHIGEARKEQRSARKAQLLRARPTP